MSVLLVFRSYVAKGRISHYRNKRKCAFLICRAVSFQNSVAKIAKNDLKAIFIIFANEKRPKTEDLRPIIDPMPETAVLLAVSTPNISEEKTRE